MKRSPTGATVLLLVLACGKGDDAAEGADSDPDSGSSSDTGSGTDEGGSESESESETGEPLPCEGDGEWTSVAMLDGSRRWPFGVTLPDERVVIGGGLGDTVQNDRRTETWILEGGSLLPVGSLEFGRYHADLALTSDGPVVMGGSGLEGTVELFDVDSATWSTIRGGTSNPGENYSTTAIPDGRAIGVGCPFGFGCPDVRADTYDPRLDAMWVEGEMVEPRSRHAAVWHEGRGAVLFIAGAMWTPDGVAYRTTVEAWDPETGEFTQIGTTSDTRMDPTANVLPDGRVLVTGGSDPDGASLSTTELFDPETGASVPGPALAEPRSNHTATSLRDGRVLVAGGADDYETGQPSIVYADAELFDPGTGSFESLPSLAEPRYAHTAVAVSDGCGVLVFGGGRSDDLAAEWPLAIEQIDLPDGA